jgi:predicted transcriptional regulator of viral defense system
MRKNALLKKMSNDGSFIRTSTLTQAEYKTLHSAVNTSDAIKLKNGLYMLTDNLHNLQFDIEQIIPGGILCMWSAWDYYGLTDSYPPAVCVAVENHRQVNIVKEPFFKLYYRSGSALTLGVTELEENGKKFLIYDREKCICDAIKYRNKIGHETMADILRTYIQNKETNPDYNKLFEYAKQLGVEKYLKIILNFASC